MVVVIELTLFASHYWERWTKAILRLADPRAQSGEGLVIRCDGLGYYAWLRSLLIDGDLSFDNEFDEHNVIGDYVPPAQSRTEAGLRPNPWSVGPACVWAFSVIPGHYGVCLCQRLGLPWRADGYALPYQLLVALTTLIASWIGLVFLYRICRRFAAPAPAVLAAACLTLGTPIVYYSAIEVSMAHGIATAALAAFICYWLESYGSDRMRRWILAGFLLGLAGLMRWQLLGFAVLLAGEALFTLGRRSLCRVAAGLVLSGGAAAMAFFPQLVGWGIVYGRWLAHPIEIGDNWLHPAWQQILVDPDRGLFCWTPLTLVALFGMTALLLSRGNGDGEANGGAISPPRQPALLLGAGFILQVYLLAAMWGPGVYLGAAYGMRHLTESSIALGPGLAWALARTQKKPNPVVAAVLLLVLGNLLLLSLYRYGWIPAAGPIDLGTLPGLIVKLIQRKKLLALGPVFAGPLLLGFFAYGIYDNQRCSQ